VKKLKMKMENHKNILCETLGIFSGMNSACPKAKGRRAVKNLSEQESVKICVPDSYRDCGDKNRQTLKTFKRL